MRDSTSFWFASRPRPAGFENDQVSTSRSFPCGRARWSLHRYPPRRPVFSAHLIFSDDVRSLLSSVDCIAQNAIVAPGPAGSKGTFQAHRAVEILIHSDCNAGHLGIARTLGMHISRRLDCLILRHHQQHPPQPRGHWAHQALSEQQSPMSHSRSTLTGQLSQAFGQSM